jgi:hypothetical protein
MPPGGFFRAQLVSLERKEAEPFPEVLDVKARVEEGAYEHVAADAGETVKIDMSH